jgi:CDP-diacylglycerol--serine O-phosphatidyltransferase
VPAKATSGGLCDRSGGFDKGSRREPQARDRRRCPCRSASAKRRKGSTSCPTAITLAALFGGFYAIVMAMNGRFDLAAIGIFCAMVLDSLDGRVARMTNTQSAFGEQMDSLSDMVSFGAAPALIVYEWALKGLGKLGLDRRLCLLRLRGAAAGALQHQHGVVDKRFFQGLPSRLLRPW